MVAASVSVIDSLQLVSYGLFCFKKRFGLQLTANAQFILTMGGGAGRNNMTPDNGCVHRRCREEATGTRGTCRRPCPWLVLVAPCFTTAALPPIFPLQLLLPCRHHPRHPACTERGRIDESNTHGERALGVGFMCQGSGLRPEAVGCGIQGFGYRVRHSGSGSKVWGSKVWGWSLGSRIWDFGVGSLGFRA